MPGIFEEQKDKTESILLTLRLRYSFTLGMIRVVAGRMRCAAKVVERKLAPRAMTWRKGDRAIYRHTELYYRLVLCLYHA